MEYIGMDVHKQESQVCIEDTAGTVVLEQRIRTTRERFTAVLGGRPRARILLEAATESEWVAQHLEALGHEVIVADPNFAPMYATRSRRVKTDRRDARTLAEACRVGAYHPAHRASAAQREVRAELAVREALVRSRVRAINVIRALLRQEGARIGSGSPKGFRRRLAELALPTTVAASVTPLVTLLQLLDEQIAAADAQIGAHARTTRSSVAWRRSPGGRGDGHSVRGNTGSRATVRGTAASHELPRTCSTRVQFGGSATPRAYHEGRQYADALAVGRGGVDLVSRALA